MRFEQSFAIVAAAGLMLMGLGVQANGQTPAYVLLDVIVSPGEGGMVSVDPEGYSYEVDSWVTLEATPADGYQFDGWTGDVVAYDPVLTIVMAGNTEITANFSLAEEQPVETCVLTLIADPSGAGTLLRDPVAAAYEPGTDVTITAVADPGYAFANWGGDVAETIEDLTNPEIVVTVDGDMDVIANFAAASTVIADTPETSSTASGGSSGGRACGSVGMISLGLTACALTGWRRRR